MNGIAEAKIPTSSSRIGAGKLIRSASWANRTTVPTRASRMKAISTAAAYLRPLVQLHEPLPEGSRRPGMSIRELGYPQVTPVAWTGQ